MFGQGFSFCFIWFGGQTHLALRVKWWEDTNGKEITTVGFEIIFGM